MGKIWLVGAGPGDEELITLKGIRALEQADVVLYDALASSQLLKYCKPECEKVYVGKKAGIHEYQQLFINDMMVRYAREFETVVRLKGGDPYVFGRGHEELEYVRSQGVEAAVIPGISSALSVPALSGIPVTKRGMSESFWVVTGTTRNGTLSADMALAARSTATVIVLMGMKNLAEIVEVFSAARGGEEHIAIIQNGTCRHERKVAGTLKTILAQVETARITSPAIIMIGAVVKEGGLTEIAENTAAMAGKGHRSQ